MSMYVHAAAMLLLGTLHVCFTLNLTLTQCVGWQALLYILQAQFPPPHILGSLHSCTAASTKLANPLWTMSGLSGELRGRFCLTSLLLRWHWLFNVPFLKGVKHLLLTQKLTQTQNALHFHLLRALEDNQVGLHERGKIHWKVKLVLLLKVAFLLINVRVSSDCKTNPRCREVHEMMFPQITCLWPN